MRKKVLYERLLKESLFKEWQKELLALNRYTGDDDFATYIWGMAKDYAYNIAISVDPVGMFEFCRNELDNKYNTRGLPPINIYDVCMGCIYTMIIKSADKAVVEQITKNIPVSDFVYPDLQDKINDIIDKINKGELKDDYDYTKKKDSQNADANKVNTADNGKTQELEKRIQELEKSKEELEKSKEDLVERLAAYEEGPIVDNPHNKVVLEVFVKLLEKSGADLDKHGNKAIAARLAETITGLKVSTCTKYMTNRNLNITALSEEVVTINILLKKLGIEWQL